jgi:RNA polymerase primary sigma factor
MPRIASAVPSNDEEANSSRVDDLIQRGRSQGHLSLSDLRTAFEQAGLTPAEARSILRELSEAGVRLADEETDLSAAGKASRAAKGETKQAKAASKSAAAAKPAVKKARSKKADEDASAASAASGKAATATVKKDSDDVEVSEDDVVTIEADVAAFADGVDLDDQTPAMGDSVHTYLKSIGRTSLLTAEQEVDLAKRIEAGLFAENKLDSQPDLSPQHRRDLELVAEDGRRAKAHMLEANLRLVVSVAKKYSDRGLSLLDVVQEGNLGLIRAVEKFDYTKGYKFSTYAMWWIRQAIQRGFADSARTIRLPVHVLEMLSKLSRVERDMHQRLGREPTPEELAVELDRTPDQIEELLRTSRQPISLDSTIGEDGETSIGDLIEDVDAPEASELVDRQLMAEQLRSALDALTPREATIMAMRFGLYDGTACRARPPAGPGTLCR